MPDLKSVLAELGITQYYDDFVEQGFDSWQTILDITESDFDVLKVKLGHRRKLQRKIANSRGYSPDRALEPRNSPTLDRTSDDQQKTKNEAKDNGVVLGTKRKYRRHPKPDENAPERPPSAYVIFSNKMREELKGRNLSFTEIAKLVGEKWQNLSPSQKEQFEQQAYIDKERYNNELNEYKKTERYREYSRYLTDFKARHSRQNSGETDSVKRPKLEAMSNCSSSSAGSCSASQVGDKSSVNSQSEPSSASTPSSTTLPWPRPRNVQGSLCRELPALTSPAPCTINGTIYKSPILKSPIMSLGSRSTALSSSPIRNQPVRDSQRDESMSIHQQMRGIEINERQTNPPEQLPHLQYSYQNASQIHQLQIDSQDSHGQRPLKLSLNGNISPAIVCPRTPLEPPLDRDHQVRVYVEPNPEEKFERQLPPIRRLSMSPKSRAQDKLQSQQFSSHLFNRYIDFSSRQMPPIRNLGDFADHHMHQSMSMSASEGMKLDPVSALLRAGQIFSQDRVEKIT